MQSQMKCSPTYATQQPANFWRSSTTAGQQAPTNSEGSNNDPNPQEREIPQTGSQLPPHKPHQLCWQNYGESCQPTNQVVPGDQRPFGTRTSWLSPVPCDLRSDHILGTGNRKCVPGKDVTHVAWIDIQLAFDKVWIDGLIVKLMRNGVANNILNWIQSYLFIYLTGEHESVLTNSTVRQGVPQGGVLSRPSS